MSSGWDKGGVGGAGWLASSTEFDVVGFGLRFSHKKGLGGIGFGGWGVDFGDGRGGGGDGVVVGGGVGEGVVDVMISVLVAEMGYSR